MDQDEVDLLQYLRVIYRWKWAILIILLTSALTAYVVSSRMIPVYQASASALVKADAAMSAIPLFQAQMGAGANAAQNYVEILRSRTLLERVLARLGMDVPVDSAEFQDLRNSISAQLAQGANTIKVTVNSTDPFKAAQLANAMIDMLIQESQRSNQESARTAREFLEQRLKVSEGQLRRAEQALLDYKRSHRVIEPSEETKAQIEKISSLETALSQTEVAISELRANTEQMQKDIRAQNPTLVTSETVVGNPLIEQYKGKLSELEVDLAGAREKYTDKHPTVLSLRSQIQELKEKLNNEVERVVSAQTTTLNPIHQQLLSQLVQAEAQIVGLQAKRDALKELVAQNEAMLTTIPEKELNLARLMREQRVAEEIYVMLLTKYEETKITEQSCNEIG
ncbi:MAG: hypothetical protein HPY52_11375 [Firmicutes bacterium]|nr:hypothetical protein [Bacillota bacterium]